MQNETIGELIATLRKQKNMTQTELANKMNVTDKAVSKWERNLSCPDIKSIPKLAEILDISVDELVKAQKRDDSKDNKTEEIINIALKGVALAMGVSVAVISIFKEIDMYHAFTMLGIGLASIGIYLLKNK